LGECAAREHPNSLIVRTAWLYGRHGRHFPGAMLAQARKGGPLRVVNDQTGCPTWTCDLAQGLVSLLDRGCGILHLAGSGCCTWYGFAQAVLEEARRFEDLRPLVIEPITTAQLNRPAPRPHYSVLASMRLAELGIGPLPHWHDALSRFFADVKSGVRS
jgi:dTDP-4-dehydrorhamnose reductase